jgi:hypothetical protein
MSREEKNAEVELTLLVFTTVRLHLHEAFPKKIDGELAAKHFLRFRVFAAPVLVG